MDITQQLKDLGEKLERMDETVRDMYYALVGNKVTMDGGLIRRVEDVEKEQDKIWTKIEDMEKAQVERDKKVVKSNVYLYLLCVAAGFILYSLAQFVIQLILKKNSI